MIIKTSYPFMKPPPSARLIRGHRLAQGLVGRWPFSAGGGLQVFDLSGNGNNGILFTGVGGDTHWESGKYGSCVDFDGSNDYITIGKGGSLDTMTTNATIIVSLIADDWTHTNYIGIIARRDTYATRDWALYYDHLGNQEINFMDSTKNAFAAQGLVPPTGVDFTLAIVKTGTDIAIYKDGVLWGTDTGMAAAWDTSDNVFFGIISSDAALSCLDGRINDVSFYNRALTAAEIAELYAKPFGMFERRARTALMSGYEVVIPPIGMAGAMTTNTGYWGY